MDMFIRRAGLMDLLRCLCRLILQALAKVCAYYSRSLLEKKSQIDEHVRPALMEEAASIVGTESPELPVDILMDIFALLEIPDLLRAGSVCSEWHAAYTSLRNTGSYKRHHTPCILYTSESDADNVACIYNLAEERVYRVTLPEPPIRRRYLIGSSNGWLVTADERSELHIVNPITGEQIALPSVTTIEQVKPIFDDAGVLQKYQFWLFSREEEYRDDPTFHALDKLRDKLYFKAFVFFDDASTGRYIVVLIHNPYELSIARAGDSKWTWLPACAAYDDCIYVDGVLYAVTATSGVDAFDLTGPCKLMKVIVEGRRHYIFGKIYITMTSLGDLLLVWREPWEEGTSIKLYKVDMEAKKLVKINGLHDHVLFLGSSQSYCLSAEEYPSFKANHVYLTEDEKYMASSKRNRRDIGVFNLESNSVEEIVPPRSWCSWPAPIWIAPNFSKMG